MLKANEPPFSMGRAMCSLCLRRASFAEVATKAESGFAKAGRPLAVLTGSLYAPLIQAGVAWLDGPF
ncbi:MAG: hypothetical protein H0X47_14380 [Nitrospirales bacterium]|nr:hypothetical protein [Nitrospirales bacterium]